MIRCYCESVYIQPEYSDLPCCICKGLCSTKLPSQPFAYATGFAKRVRQKLNCCSERICLHCYKWLSQLLAIAVCLLSNV